jgi:polyisoprenoid-binding protein YceI
MGIARLARRLRAFGLVACLWPAILAGQSRAIDTGRSVVTIHVFKSGLFSGFAHNHEIAAPIAEGAVEVSQQMMSLRVDARSMRVLDPEAAGSTRADIQKTMQGPTVLDSERFPEIAFQSTSVEQAGNDHWSVRGNLTLHGR